MLFPFRYALLAFIGLFLQNGSPANGTTNHHLFFRRWRRHTPVDPRGGVQMTNQRSGAACQQGYSWGYNREASGWTSCRADFMVNSWIAEAIGPDHYCSSDDGGDIPAVSMRGRRADDQPTQRSSLSEATAGYTAEGIWVDHGCRADFNGEKPER